jgi:DNA-binding LacI/PurR family transcriptional regulator
VILEHDIESLPCIAIDDYRGGFIATEHLVHLGHHRIGFIQQQPTYTTSQRRLDGYLDALRANGIEPDRSLIVASGSGYGGGMEAMQVLLALPGHITAVFAHNDVIALGAMRAIYAAGLTVPGDVSVVGYDDITSAAFYMPPLTTVSYPAEAMAQSAARQLFAMLSPDHGPQRPVTELLPVHLEVRQSTAPLTKG